MLDALGICFQTASPPLFSLGLLHSCLIYDYDCIMCSLIYSFFLLLLPCLGKQKRGMEKESCSDPCAGQRESRLTVKGLWKPFSLKVNNTSAWSVQFWASLTDCVFSPSEGNIWNTYPIDPRLAWQIRARHTVVKAPHIPHLPLSGRLQNFFLLGTFTFLFQLYAFVTHRYVHLFKFEGRYFWTVLDLTPQKVHIYRQPTFT